MHKTPEDYHQINLAHPFEHDGQLVQIMSLRRPTCADLERAQNHDNIVTEGIQSISNLAEVSPDLVRKMDAADYLKASLWIKKCMADSLD